ncbi:MAG: winged helix DNA-binding protein [Sphingomonas sp.]
MARSATSQSPTAFGGHSYAHAPNALVVAEGEDAAQIVATALAAAGIREMARVNFTEAPSRLDEQAALDLVLIEAEGISETLLDAVLARASAVARDLGAAVVAAIDANQIDVAAAHLLGGHSQLLCAPSAAERVAALAVAKLRPRSRLNDASNDGEAERLRRLNEEVARIAEVLARLTRGEEAERHDGVREPGSGYRGPEDELSAANAQEIRALIRSRRLRAQFFAGELFADPAWDMLLDLFAAQLEHRRVSVSSLCIAAAVPPTTALRWIGTLHDAGLFERQADPSDRRRAYIALSAKGIEGMRGYIAAAKRQGLGLA